MFCHPSKYFLEEKNLAALTVGMIVLMLKTKLNLIVVLSYQRTDDDGDICDANGGVDGNSGVDDNVDDVNGGAEMIMLMMMMVLILLMMITCQSMIEGPDPQDKPWQGRSSSWSNSRWSGR